MERDWPATQLEQGRSLEQIGAEVGRDASTVGYWVKKHGLVAAHARKHAARGGVNPDELGRLVASGASFRTIAAEMDVSPTTIRHWVHKLGLETRRMKRLRQGSCHGPGASDVVSMRCPRHGPTEFRRRRTGYRCGRCATEAVSRWRRRVKETLVAEAGGRCALCGYDRHIGALHFHHLEPASKAFSVGATGVTRSLAKARVEAAKCVLLCSNCHAEVEGGIVRLPDGADAPVRLDDPG